MCFCRLYRHHHDTPVYLWAGFFHLLQLIFKKCKRKVSFKIMRKKKVKLQFLSLLMTVCFILNIVTFVSLPGQAAANEQAAITAGEMVVKGIKFINDKYKAGEKIDGYTVYVLTLAGEDLSTEKWTSNGKTLKSQIENLSDLLGNSNSLINYISSTQNNDGSFGPYANEYGTKVPLQALAAVKDDLTVGTDVYNQVQNSINNAINYFKTKYQNGSMTYDVNGWNFDYRCVEALAKAGEDLSVGGWVYNGTSLKDTVIASAGATAANPTVKDAVYLAKELTALYAVDPTSTNINILADAIVSKQAVDGSFGTSIYDHIMVLTALGKTGKLSGIDQINAFNYIDSLKQTHKNSWGQDAGVAWGSRWTTGFEESDTTAQVITALSYFSGANTEGSGVYKVIQDGLTYLKDVQDADTAAIVRTEGDSTFATAETLIALKSVGKTFSQYAGSDSEWVKKSRTKTIAQCLLALNNWNDTTRRDRLANLLIDRQKTADPGKGSFENSVYSDMWAYIALGEAGKIGNLKVDDVKTYILSKQSADGSWGEKFGDTYYPDVMSTAQAIRAITYLPGAASDQQVQAAITRGLAYLKGLQQADGGVYSTLDDPAVDNSELIVTLHRLGKDPAGTDWKSAGGLTPVDYLLNKTMNNDGSFGTSKNVFGATEALAAYRLVTGQGTPGGNNPDPPAQDEYSVGIAVVGRNGELLYGPGSVTVSKNGKWGLTALGALHATGLSYTDDGGFVKSIAGQANSGMNGWMYKVNGTVPMMLASDKAVNKEDKVIWWYSKDMNSPGPTWDSLFENPTVTQPGAVIPANLQEQNKNLPVALQASENALTALEKIEQLLSLKEKTVELGTPGEAVRTVAVVGNEQPLDLVALAAMKKELAQNVVELTQKVTADKGAIITDAKAEVALSVPIRALNNDVEITVKKIAAGNIQGNGTQPTAPAGFCQVSATYDFGPDGTTFDIPVTLTLKLAIPPLIKPDNLTLAWYNKSTGKWVAIPAVVDVNKGLILAKVQHFSNYAVFAREPAKSFADITPNSFGWARNTIETLAGAGIVAGVNGTHFEPARAVTRAEFTSLLVKALRLQTKTYTGNPLKDVRADDWYAGAVTAAYDAGLVKGYEDGTFRPDSTITREEAAAILVRAMKLQTTEQKLPFTDCYKINSWARASVATASTYGLIKGLPDGTFRPDVTAGRAECAVMVYRMLTNY